MQATPSFASQLTNERNPSLEKHCQNVHEATLTTPVDVKNLSRKKITFSAKSNFKTDQIAASLKKRRELSKTNAGHKLALAQFNIFYAP